MLQGPVVHLGHSLSILNSREFDLRDLESDWGEVEEEGVVAITIDKSH